MQLVYSNMFICTLSVQIVIVRYTNCYITMMLFRLYFMIFFKLFNSVELKEQITSKSFTFQS